MTNSQSNGGSLATIVKYSVSEIQNQTSSAIYKLRNDIRKVTPRVRNCGHVVADKTQPILIVDGQKGSTYYSNLQTCKSVWACPFCALKIAERRRLEISKAINSSKQNNHNILFSTFTIKHKIGDSLEDSLLGLKKSWDKVTRSTFYQGNSKKDGLKDNFKIIGYIKSLEFTYGNNGWHPHYHVLFFSESSKNSLMVFGDLFKLKYIAEAKKLGFNLSEKTNNFKIADDDMEDYMTKWGIASEMTKNNSKSSKNPFELFKLFQSTGEKKYLSMWLEYVDVTKGSRFILFSSKLKDLYKIDIITDEGAVQDDLTDEVRAKIDLRFWKFLIMHGIEYEVMSFMKYKQSEFWQFLEINCIDYEIVNDIYCIKSPPNHEFS